MIESRRAPIIVPHGTAHNKDICVSAIRACSARYTAYVGAPGAAELAPAGPTNYARDTELDRRVRSTSGITRQEPHDGQ